MTRQLSCAIRVLAVLGLAFGFGLASALLKGSDASWRDELGNLSAPWLIVALLPAMWSGGALRGALVGFCSTTVALLGFYLGSTFLLHGHFGLADSSLLNEFRFDVSANRLWFEAGTVSGPVMGALGGWLGARRRSAVVAVAGLLLLFEVAVVAVAGHVELPVLGSWGAISSWPPYLVESLLGAAVLLVLVRRKSA